MWRTRLTPRAGRLIPICLAIVSFPSYGATVLYVDDDAPSQGDGQSWNTACRFLSDALTIAEESPDPPIEIRVAQGVYTPDKSEAAPNGTGDRTASFVLQKNVALIGGFAGLSAKDPDVRDVKQFDTVLSGDLLQNDGSPDSDIGFGPANNAENSLHVLFASVIDATAILDGFTITAGNANGTQDPVCFGGPQHDQPCDPDVGCPDGHCASEDSKGAGLLGFFASPIIRNCTFINNFAAFQAGGVQLKFDCDAIFESCSFIGNRALDNGGAMYLGESSPTIMQCVFDSNQGVRYAGAICIRNQSDALIQECMFIDNTAAEMESTGGGAIVNASSSPTIIDCYFGGNSAVSGSGGAVYNKMGFDAELGPSQPTIIDCTFENNISLLQGGAIGNFDQTLVSIEGCTFIGNESFKGGAVYLESATDATVSDCHFVRNDAFRGACHYLDAASLNLSMSHFIANTCGEGGGVYANGGEIVVDQCTFVRNIASSQIAGGSGVWSQFGGQSFISNSYFLGNWGDYGGAGVYSQQSPTTVVNSVFVGNVSRLQGGAGFWSNGTGAFAINCTFVENHTDTGESGAIINRALTGGVMTVSNCVLWKNGEVPIFDDGDGITVLHCDVQGGYAGTGNFDADPMIAIAPHPGDDGVWTTPDDDYGDVRILAGSPAIDAGHTASFPDSMSLDLDGNPRFVEDVASPDCPQPNVFCDNPPVIDLGAYEFQPPLSPGDLNGDGIVGAADLAILLGAWGQCPIVPVVCSSDLDFDGFVGSADLAILLGIWS